MKTKQELEQFFDREILPNLSPLQKHLGKERANLMSVLYMFVFLFILFIAGQPMFYLPIFFGYVLYLFFVADKNNPEKERQMLATYQRLVAKPIIIEMEPTLRYSPFHGVLYTDILASKLAYADPTKKFIANNLITYKNDDIPVRLSHIYLEHKNEEGDYVPVLGGLFAVTDARRPVEGTTIVSFDIAERFLGFVGQGLQPKKRYWGLEKTRLDSPGFEKEYVVHASDPIEAHYLLSHTVMEKLTHLIQEYKLFPRLSFVKDKIYVAVLSGGFFQPLSASGQLTFKDVELSINSLEFAREVIKVIHHHHHL